MTLEIPLALDGENGSDIIFLETLHICRRFGIAAHEDLRSDLREDELVDVALVEDIDFPARMGDLGAVGMGRVLVGEVEAPSRPALALDGTGLADVVIVELRPGAVGVEGEGKVINLLPSTIPIPTG